MAEPAASATPGPATSTSTSTSTSVPTTTTTPSRDPSDPVTTSLPAASIPADPEVGVSDVARHASPGGAGPDPLIIGGLLAAVLAAGAWVRWRKRPRTP